MNNVTVTFPTTGNGAAFCESCHTFLDFRACSHDHDAVIAALPVDHNGLPVAGTVEEVAR